MFVWSGDRVTTWKRLDDPVETLRAGTKKPSALDVSHLA